MPEIYVHAVKGRSLDQKRALIKDITEAVVKNFSVPAEAVMVEIVESEPTAKAKGGVLFSEMRREGGRPPPAFRPVTPGRNFSGLGRAWAISKVKPHW
jgi:4-oxalocrotonate tautomerase